MTKRTRKYQEATKLVGENSTYSLQEAVGLAKQTASAKFDETLEMAARLGVDPRHADQMIRGTVVLPHGTGKDSRVLVFAQGEKAKEAEDAGADVVGGEDLAKRVSDGWLEFDAVVSTPDMMRVVGKLGRVLGPRGLMPNPKTGTVTFDVASAVNEIKAGKIEFRVDKTAIVHAPFGKASFTAVQLDENARALLSAILKARPSATKGKYIKSLTVSSTMGPGIRIDEGSLAGAAEG